MPDFTATNHGSLWIVTPHTEAAREHLAEHLSAEAQWWAGGLVVEPRYVGPLMATLDANGFECAA